MDYFSALNKLLQLYDAKKDEKEFTGNEAQVRQSLVAPFFRDILGWNIDDPDEFRFEKHIAGKRADIIAYVDGISQFVIEVKSLSQRIFDNAEFYKQAIQYADGLEKDYAILTNFKEFVILRSDFEAKKQNWLTLEVGKLNIEDLRSDLGLLGYFRRSIWFGDKHELSDLTQKFEQNYSRRKPINDRLLDLFVKWRSKCLSWLKKNKPKLFNEYSTEFVEEEVQRYLDRIIFITYCEDKQLEDTRLRQFIGSYKSTLQIEGHVVTKGLKKIVEHYYSRYDSDLFDTGLADRFEFDDSITYEILCDIKTPQSELPYDFSQIPLDVLGKTYENFIGHLTKGRKNMEEIGDMVKRKQEGIFYTPQWIVDQIISRTIRPYVKDLSLDELFNVKILDPACGSGTFLIAAFREMIRQAEISEKRNLTYDERKKLFLSCLYGVDKDDRACDIAKLNVSLLLAEQNKRLPSLSKNIQTGDSLVFSTIDDYTKSVNWEEKFSHVFARKNPGFDIIVGNPPYLSAKDFDEGTKFVEILRREFGEVKDLYWLFLKLSDRLIRIGGIWGFIVPNTFFTLTHFNDIREMLRSKYSSYVIDLSPNVFKDAYVFNAILNGKRVEEPESKISMGYLAKESTGKVEFKDLFYDEITRYPKMPLFIPTELYEQLDKKILRSAGILYQEFKEELSNNKKLLKNNDKIENHTSSLRPGCLTLLGLICEGSQGLVTGNNSRYLGVLPKDNTEREEIWKELNDKIKLNSRNHEYLEPSIANRDVVYEKAEELKNRKKKPTLFGKKFLYKTILASEVRDYSVLNEQEQKNGIADSENVWIVYFRGNEDGESWKVKNSEYICWSQRFVSEMKEGKITNSRWQGDAYFFKPGFGWVDYFDERIKGFFVEPTVYSKNVVKFHSTVLPDEYILGLLNSSYISYYVRRYITNTRTLQINDGKLIPVIIPEEKTMNEVVRLVKEIIHLKEQLGSVRNDNEKQRITENVLEDERKIDDLVIEIYGLTLRDSAFVDIIRAGQRY